MGKEYGTKQGTLWLSSQIQNQKDGRNKKMKG
jgi:hypothetical protein